MTLAIILHGREWWVIISSMYYLYIHCINYFWFWFWSKILPHRTSDKQTLCLARLVHFQEAWHLTMDLHMYGISHCFPVHITAVCRIQLCSIIYGFSLWIAITYSFKSRWTDIKYCPNIKSPTLNIDILLNNLTSCHVVFVKRQYIRSTW